MKAKEYLNKIKLMDARINSDMDHIATLEALATKITPNLGGERVQTSGNQQKMEDMVCKIHELREKVSKEIDEFIDYKEQARQLIHDYCDEQCITLLSKRYLGSYDYHRDITVYMTWEQIAVDMNMSFKWVSCGLHQKALAQIQVGLDKNDDFQRK